MPPIITITLHLDEHLSASLHEAQGTRRVELIDDGGRYERRIALTDEQFDRLAAFIASARAHLGRGEYGDARDGQ